MNRLAHRCAAVLGAAALAATVGTGTAHATPGRGVHTVTVFDQVVGNTEYALKEITLAPGGSTGWHYHPGPVVGLITHGVLTHDDATCHQDGSYRPGQTVTERSGPGYVHIGRNLGATPVVLEVFYRNPVGHPLAVDTPNPGCGFD